MRVLIACERSGVVRRAFRARGHDAWSCDLVDADDGSFYHRTRDCREVLVEQPWDLLIAHPPCTHLSLSGARWLTDHWVKRKKGEPWWHDGSLKRAQQEEAVLFFRALLEAKVPRICLENPMSMASTLVRPKDQTIHPWQFGHREFKTTWLWLKNLPLLKPTKIIQPPAKGTPEHAEWSKVHRMPPGPERERMRSVTYDGIAQAMAEQWGGPT